MSAASRELSLGARASSFTRSPQPTDAVAVSGVLERAGLRPNASSALILERGWPLPRVPLMLRFRDPDVEGKTRRWWSLHCMGCERLPFPFRSALKQRRAEYLPELRAVVQVFPDELALTGVDAAISSRLALPTLSEALAGEVGEFQRLTARVLGYKPSRRLTVRYRLSGLDATGTTLFGKCFPSAGAGQAARAHTELKRAMRRDGPGPLRLPRLVGEVPRWNMLLWRRQSGRSIYDLLGNGEIGRAAELAGHCLAELHASSTRWRRIHDRSRELQTLEFWVSAVAVSGSNLERPLQAVLEKLRRTAGGSQQGPLVPAHRDFYDKQIVLEAESGALLDLETACRAEPELDVANFIAHLELRAMQGYRIDVAQTADAFVGGYSHRLSGCEPQRLRWYLASALARLACVYWFRSEWQALPVELIGAATRASVGD